MTQAVSTVKSKEGFGCWLSSLKPELEFLNWEFYCLMCIRVLEVLQIQNLELLAGKGKGRV